MFCGGNICHLWSSTNVGGGRRGRNERHGFSAARIVRAQRHGNTADTRPQRMAASLISEGVATVQEPRSNDHVRCDRRRPAPASVAQATCRVVVVTPAKAGAHSSELEARACMPDYAGMTVIVAGNLPARPTHPAHHLRHLLYLICAICGKPLPVLHLPPHARERRRARARAAPRQHTDKTATAPAPPRAPAVSRCAAETRGRPRCRRGTGAAAPVPSRSPARAACRWRCR